MDQMLNTVMMMVVMQMLPKLIEAIGSLFTALELGKRFRGWNTKQYKFKLELEQSITRFRASSESVYSDFFHDTGQCIQAIQLHLSELKANGDSIRFHPTKGKAIPTGKIVHDGIEFEFSESENRTDSVYHKTIRLEVRSDVSKEHMIAFVTSALERYEEQRRGAPERFFYQQRPSAKDSSCHWLAYPIRIDTGWDSIYYPEKEELQRAVADLQPTGKLVLLLHGPPGTGKTSTIRAIAKSTNRHIVNVDLTLVSNNQELMSIFFGQDFWSAGDGNQIRSRPRPDQSIFVLEEVDTQLEKVSSRGQAVAEVAEKEEKKPKLTLAEMVKALADRLTIGGLLTVLDGVLELHNVIVIMTTNHPDRLDPRLVRPGRVTHEICLGPMRAEDASRLIRKKFPDAPSNLLADDQILPSKLAQLIARSKSLDQLIALLK